MKNKKGKELEQSDIEFLEGEFVNVKQSTIRSVEGGHLELQQVGALSIDGERIEVTQGAAAILGLIAAALGMTLFRFLVKMDYNINDPEFADRCAEVLLDMLE